jgi:hypothetical protein
MLAGLDQHDRASHTSNLNSRSDSSRCTAVNDNIRRRRITGQKADLRQKNQNHRQRRRCETATAGRKAKDPAADVKTYLHEIQLLSEVFSERLF